MQEFFVLDVARGDAASANVAILLREGYEIVAPDGLLVFRKATPRLKLQATPPAEAPVPQPPCSPAA